MDCRFEGNRISLSERDRTRKPVKFGVWMPAAAALPADVGVA
jgi:hypothetical protein